MKLIKKIYQHYLLRLFLYCKSILTKFKNWCKKSPEHPSAYDAPTMLFNLISSTLLASVIFPTLFPDLMKNYWLPIIIGIMLQVLITCSWGIIKRIFGWDFNEKFKLLGSIIASIILIAVCLIKGWIKKDPTYEGQSSANN